MVKPVTPLLTVDIVIELTDQPGRPIVLIERRYPPYGWALPGGFVDVGEHLEQAAVREAQEETSLDINLVCLLGCYSDPQRDARGHTVSAVYVATASGEARAQDDAKNLALFDPAQCPELVFDHARILEDYLRWRETGQPAPLVPGQQV
ncbi:MAG: NUDIX hydrolase [Gammaproteobacteria bacterium]|nr:MAG: NUDIX hydrolase [Gammaproteobacteria bacterium]